MTIEAAPSEMFTSDIYSFMVENPNLMDRLGINPEDYHYVANKASYFDQNEFTKKLVKTPEYQEWLASRPMELLQIKGKGNMKPNKEYIPFVQDFVQQSVWTRLGDIENADFVPLNDRMFDSLRSRDIRFNYSFLDEGSVPYVTKEEFSRLQDVLRGSE